MKTRTYNTVRLGVSLRLSSHSFDGIKLTMKFWVHVYDVRGTFLPLSSI